MNRTGETVIIYGAGGFAREVTWLIDESYPGMLKMVGYIEDDIDKDRLVDNKPVRLLEEYHKEYPEARVVIAIGNGKTRKQLSEKVKKLGFSCMSLLDKSVRKSPSFEMGNGGIICAGSILTVNVKLGDQVHVNLDCTVGHDTVIGSYTTLAPGVHISGNVVIGEGVYIGTGANIINGTSSSPLKIGDNAVIGAGACVTSDVESNALYAGVPAKLKKLYN